MKSVDNGTTSTYTYNALGQMVQLNWVAQNRVRDFPYSPFGQELGQYTTNFQVWEDQYVLLGGRQIAKYYGCCDTVFVHPNHLGSTAMITKADGSTVRDLLFYPWGQQWQNVGSNWDLHFASLWQREFASNLDPTPNRMYHPRLYRWQTPDPLAGDVIDPQSLNRYAYVLNNPTNGIDPTGLFTAEPYQEPCSPANWMSNARCRSLPAFWVWWESAFWPYSEADQIVEGGQPPAVTWFKLPPAPWELYEPLPCSEIFTLDGQPYNVTTDFGTVDAWHDEPHRGMDFSAPQGTPVRVSF